MERIFRYLYLLLAAVPLALLVTSFTYYQRAKNDEGVVPSPVVLRTIDMQAGAGTSAKPVYHWGSVLLAAVPVCFCIFFLISVLTYFIWRRQLSQRHFYIQAACYLPYLAFVILTRFPQQNPLRWFLQYLVA